MTSEEWYQSVSEFTASVFEKNKELISKQILSGCTKQDAFPQLYSKLIINAIQISMQLSVQSTIGLLEQIELLDPSEIEEVQKPANTEKFRKPPNLVIYKK